MNQPASTGTSQGSTSTLVKPSSAHPVLDPETQQFLDLVAEAGQHPDRLLLQRPASSDESDPRQAQSSEPFPVTTEDLTLPIGPTGSVDVRIVRPLGASSALPAVVYFPGGGWSMGDRITHDRLIRRLAVQAEAAVVFVEYTRTPEARYPTQNEQAYAALIYVIEHASSLGIDSRAIAVAGDGAGGNMAAVITLLAKVRRGPRVALQILFCPILSANMTSGSYNRYADGPGLTALALQSFIRAQFPTERLTDKTAMPLHATTADLEGLPAALIITAEHDVVRDDAEAYARNLMRAGVQVNATRYLGTIHDFVVLEGLADTFLTDAALTQACTTLKRSLRLAASQVLS
ncbi:alpha/beta hydrolase [Paraburkholderia phenazinium]|jgi:acetyl esterase|uniref:Acetyl esterase n=1 Tax=Paraburkholderia phenazinium TaxID=60549 RepID=A0A1G7RR43_9BURK|nr:alpha/beta hydrolase [Paraburkholderia phenazinium]SDG12689.1 acetyl esterase [Paraburkholderia phenazinium]